MYREMVLYFSRRSRMRRGNILRSYFPNVMDLEIVDLGGGNGQHIRMLLPTHQNITVADLDPEDLKRAAARGCKTKQFDGGQKLPFESNSIDLIFCSSVIEHVTIPKEDVWICSDDQIFDRDARESQRKFAHEIVRCSNGYFVQTPNKYFWIESHTWLPFLFIFLPRSIQIKLLRFTNRFWFKETRPDFQLLTTADMKALFPDADIVVERVLWGVKSIMAIRRWRPQQSLTFWCVAGDPPPFEFFSNRGSCMFGSLILSTCNRMNWVRCDLICRFLRHSPAKSIDLNHFSSTLCSRASFSHEWCLEF